MGELVDMFSGEPMQMHVPVDVIVATDSEAERAVLEDIANTQDIAYTSAAKADADMAQFLMRLGRRQR